MQRFSAIYFSSPCFWVLLCLDKLGVLAHFTTSVLELWERNRRSPYDKGILGEYLVVELLGENIPSRI